MYFEHSFTVKDKISTATQIYSDDINMTDIAVQIKNDLVLAGWTLLDDRYDTDKFFILKNKDTTNNFYIKIVDSANLDSTFDKIYITMYETWDATLHTGTNPSITFPIIWYLSSKSAFTLAGYALHVFDTGFVLISKIGLGETNGYKTLITSQFVKPFDSFVTDTKHACIGATNSLGITLKSSLTDIEGQRVGHIPFMRDRTGSIVQSSHYIEYFPRPYFSLARGKQFSLETDPDASGEFSLSGIYAVHNGNQGIRGELNGLAIPRSIKNITEEDIITIKYKDNLGATIKIEEWKIFNVSCENDNPPSFKINKEFHASPNDSLDLSMFSSNFAISYGASTDLGFDSGFGDTRVASIFYSPRWFAILKE